MTGCPGRLPPVPELLFRALSGQERRGGGEVLLSFLSTLSGC